MSGQDYNRTGILKTRNQKTIDSQNVQKSNAPNRAQSNIIKTAIKTAISNIIEQLLNSYKTKNSKLAIEPAPGSIRKSQETKTRNQKL
jgi:hypothetical protein